MLPGLRLLTAAASVMAARLLAGRPGKEAAVCALVLAAALLSRGPELPGYWRNHRTDVVNDRYSMAYRSGETDTLYISMDYDHSLCYFNACTDGFSYLYYGVYAGFDGTRGEIRYTSEICYRVYVDGVQQEMMAVPDGDGKLLFHARLLEAVGGSVDWTPRETVLTLGDVTCRLVDGNSVIAAPDGAGGTRRANVPVQNIYPGSIFLPEWLFRDVFGLQFDVDAKTMRVDVTLG